MNVCLFLCLSFSSLSSGLNQRCRHLKRWPFRKKTTTFFTTKQHVKMQGPIDWRGRFKKKKKAKRVSPKTKEIEVWNCRWCCLGQTASTERNSKRFDESLSQQNAHWHRFTHAHWFLLLQLLLLSSPPSLLILALFASACVCRSPPFTSYVVCFPIDIKKCASFLFFFFSFPVMNGMGWR